MKSPLFLLVFITIAMHAQVGIGTTNPLHTLQVIGSNTNNYIASITNNSIDNNADGLVIRFAREFPNVGNTFVRFYRNLNLSSGAILGTGTGVNYFTTSDRRLKMNIENISNSLDLINSIKPRIYEYKKIPNVKEYGFLAQELQLVYPQAVYGNPNSDAEKDPMMVDYSRLTPILIAGIKDLNKKVENLEKENKKLKNKLSKIEILEARINLLEKNNKPSTSKR